jgi:two-component system, OmpR family, sensor histidine kinase ArlS
MKIRNRLALTSSLVFGVVFSLASFLVYFIFHRSSERLIFEELEKSSRLTAYFFLEEDELSKKEHQEVEREFQKIIQKNTEVRVYDEADVITYGQKEIEPAISRQVLERTRAEEKYRFKNGDYYYLGIFYPDNQGDFVIFVKENNQYFRSQAQRLLLILFMVLLAGLAAIVILSNALSSIAYRPIARVIEAVNAIEPDSLGKTLPSPRTRDEVEALVHTFNDLLLRLSDTFVIQKNFINYVSHEFRTPLASIAGNLEVFAQKQGRTPGEQAQAAEEAVQSVHQIRAILDTLLELSGLRAEARTLAPVRVDELLWDLLESPPFHSCEHIAVELDIGPEQEGLLEARGSFQQLRIAIANLLENAVKYSSGKPVQIRLSAVGEQLWLLIQDQGPGIRPEELKYIQQPFFRGSNVQAVPGSGIGLSIAGILLRQHDIALEIGSAPGQGTSVSLLFPPPRPL